MAAPTLSIVIPAYNEEVRILSTLQQVLNYLEAQPYSWEVVVADDGSTDATARLVGGVAKEDGRLSLLRLSHGGKGWAVRHGMLHARGQFRFLCDADLSMPIAQVARFLPPQLEEYDVAIGSREAPGARRIGEPWLRHFTGRIFNTVVRLLILPTIRDSQCGFKMFRERAAERLFQAQRLSGFSFDAELLFLARKWKLTLVEVPIDWHFHSESKVRLYRDTYRMTRDILLVRWMSWRGLYPKAEKEAPAPVQATKEKSPR